MAATTPRGVLELKVPRREEDAPALLDLFGRVFSGGELGYDGFLDFCRRGYFLDGTYDWESSSVGWLDGKPVTHVGVWGYRTRVGKTTLRTAGIGLVATDSAHRGRGYMKAAARHALGLARDHGYQLSVLFGDVGLYRPLGYATAWDDEDITIRVTELPAEPSRRSSVLREPISPALWPRLGELYNTGHEGLAGTAVRPTYTRSRFADLVCRLWPDTRRPRGYILARDTPRACIVFEAVGEPARILAASRALAQDWRRDTVRFVSLHPKHPLTRALRDLPTVRKTYHATGDSPMALLLDLRGALDAMAADLDAAARSAPSSLRRARIEIQDGGEACQLRMEGGRVSVEAGAAGSPPDGRILGQGGLAQLILGTDDARALAAAGALRLEGAAIELAPDLFPARSPALASWDRF